MGSLKNYTTIMITTIQYQHVTHHYIYRKQERNEIQNRGAVYAFGLQKAFNMINDSMETLLEELLNPERVLKRHALLGYIINQQHHKSYGQISGQKQSDSSLKRIQISPTVYRYMLEGCNKIRKILLPRLKKDTAEDMLRTRLKKIFTTYRAGHNMVNDPAIKWKWIIPKYGRTYVEDTDPRPVASNNSTSRTSVSWSSDLPLGIFTKILHEGYRRFNGSDLPIRGNDMESFYYLTGGPLIIAEARPMLKENLVEIKELIQRYKFAPFPLQKRLFSL
jgi:hypothetical protein